MHTHCMQRRDTCKHVIKIYFYKYLIPAPQILRGFDILSYLILSFLIWSYLILSYLIRMQSMMWSNHGIGLVQKRVISYHICAPPPLRVVGLMLAKSWSALQASASTFVATWCPCFCLLCISMACRMSHSGFHSSACVVHGHFSCNRPPLWPF